jgi:hypothetical protein
MQRSLVPLCRGDAHLLDTAEGATLEEASAALQAEMACLSRVWSVACVGEVLWPIRGGLSVHGGSIGQEGHQHGVCESEDSCVRALAGTCPCAARAMAQMRHCMC